MKTITWMIYAFVLLVGGLQNNNTFKAPDTISKLSKIAKPFGDDDPIIMHSHVKNSGGYPISGAAYTLTKAGDSTPTYSGTTDSSGNVTFSTVHTGTYMVSISASAYYPKSYSIGLFDETDRTDTLVAR